MSTPLPTTLPPWAEGLSTDIHPTIASRVADIVGAFPPDAKVEGVARVDLEGVQVAVEIRVGEAWTIQGYLDKPFSGPLTAGAEVRFSR